MSDRPTGTGLRVEQARVARFESWLDESIRH